MCGLVACISKRELGFVYHDREIFNQLLFVDSIRGEDSTGAFYVNKEGNLYSVKAAQKAAIFQETKTYKDFLTDAYIRGKFLVGHNRAATKGEKTDKNAHPFIDGNICLVHNGTLYNHKQIADTDVDSHAITMGFNKEGYIKTLDRLVGAYALIWYDAKEKTLRIARNKDRPLWMVDMADAVYIASEPGMLQWILSRHLKEKQPLPTSFETDKIYSWKLDSTQTEFSTEKYEKKVMVPTSTPTRVVTEPMKTGKGGKDARGTTKNTPFYGTYHIGDVVNFTCDKVTHYDTKVKLEGVLVDDESISVCGYLDTTTITRDTETELVCADYLNGALVGMMRKNDKITFIVNNMTPDWISYTCDEQIVTADMLDTDLNSVYCHECGDFVDIIDDSGFYWARIKNHKVKAVKCPNCAAKNKYIQKVYANED